METEIRPRLVRLLRSFLLVNGIGIAVAVGVGLYAREIEAITHLRLHLSHSLPRPIVLPLMGLAGGALAGALIRLEPAAAGSGIVHVLLFLRGRSVPMGWRVAAVKLLASGVAIGSGIPVGPEGPSIQIGASMGHVSAEALRARRHQRLAVAIGSGAGLAAIFHAPLGGLAYTLEELLGRAGIRTNAMAAFATFVAVLWTRLFHLPVGGNPLELNLRPIIEYPSRIDELRLADLPLLLALGAAAGLLALPYQRFILALGRRLRRLALPPWQLLPLVGLSIGAGWSLLPRGFDDADRLGFEALLGLEDTAHALLTLIVQGLGTAVAVAAQAPGGFLAPALVVGASLGSLVQQLVLPLLGYAPGTLLFAGAGAFLGALTRTPLTAILLTFELSKDYALLLPIGFCVLTAIAVADLLERTTINDVLLREAEPKGDDAPPGP